MTKQRQIIYMQVRLLRLASLEWKMSIDEVNKLFKEKGIYKYIEKFWDIFHIEGDYAVLEDINNYLENLND